MRKCPFIFLSCVTMDHLKFLILSICFFLIIFIFCHFLHLFQVGDLLNFLSAVFFGVHMLRTEHISRNTNKENFLPLLGYEASSYIIKGATIPLLFH